MELTLLIGIATALLAILFGLLFLQRRNAPKAEPAQRPQRRGEPQRVQEGVPRRAQIARNQRQRLARQNVNAAPAAAAAAMDNAVANDSSNDEDGIPQGQVLDEKMGAKKRAKMEMKEQKRLMREQELKQREERKAKDAKMEEERKRQDDVEAAEERQKIETERLEREARERKEHEEYLKMKEAFSVEEEGFEEGDNAEQEKLLSDFIQYIKDNKVVVLEELATEFKLKTQQAIDRIQSLQENGTITGVIDDRGKFIYVSEEELLSVAKFIKQRGRVSIADLAESSNKLINLTPAVSG